MFFYVYVCIYLIEYETGNLGTIDIQTTDGNNKNMLPLKMGGAKGNIPQIQTHDVNKIIKNNAIPTPVTGVPGGTGNYKSRSNTTGSVGDYTPVPMSLPVTRQVSDDVELDQTQHFTMPVMRPAVIPRDVTTASNEIADSPTRDIRGPAPLM